MSRFSRTPGGSSADQSARKDAAKASSSTSAKEGASLRAPEGVGVPSENESVGGKSATESTEDTAGSSRTATRFGRSPGAEGEGGTTKNQATQCASEQAEARVFDNGVSSNEQAPRGHARLPRGSAPQSAETPLATTENISESISPPPDESSRNPRHWDAWGVTPPPPGSSWVAQSCPRCGSRRKESTEGKAGNESANEQHFIKGQAAALSGTPPPGSEFDVLKALRVDTSGAFFCADCGFHGNATTTPASYTGSWLRQWEAFLRHPAWPRKCPDVVSHMWWGVPDDKAFSESTPETSRKEDAEKEGVEKEGLEKKGEGHLASDDPQRTEKESAGQDPFKPATRDLPDPPAVEPSSVITEGCWAPFWDDGAWTMAWHAWCLDRDGVLRDAHVWIPQRASWTRAEHVVKPYPMGWATVADSKGNPTVDRIVVAHNPTDAWSMMASGVAGVVVLPPDISTALPTARAWRALEAMEGTLSVAHAMVLAMGSSKSDRELEEELGRRWDRERCERVRWCPEQVSSVNHRLLEDQVFWTPSASPQFSYQEDDAEDEDEHDDQDASRLEDDNATAVWRHNGPDVVAALVGKARPFPVAGLHDLSEVEDRFEELYRTGFLPGAGTGWPSVDELYSVKTAQWTLVTGIPGAGKTTFLEGLMINLARDHHWRFAVFSPENQPLERMYASLAEKVVGLPFSKGMGRRMPRKKKDAVKPWLDENFKMILPDEETGAWSLDSVLRLARLLVYRHGIKGLVIDPWNELDHARAEPLSESEYLSESLTKIRRFARLYDVHVWIVAHPTKIVPNADGYYPVPTPYNVHGGAQWRNKADNILCVYRYVGEEDEDVVDIYVQKIRFREIGKVGRTALRADPRTCAYVDDIDHRKRTNAIAQGLHVPSKGMRLSRPRG